jgi:pimeloyl-ACP methyl ester carboxylesterase
MLSYLTTYPDVVIPKAWGPPDPRDMVSFNRVLPSLMDERFTRWLHRVNMPSLLVWGDQDRTTPIQQAERWRALLPSMQFHAVAGGGHMLLSETDEASAVIGAFLLA